METIIFSETSIVSWLDGWWLMAGVENENVVNVLVILIVCHFVSSCVINDTFYAEKLSPSLASQMLLFQIGKMRRHMRNDDDDDDDDDVVVNNSDD